MRALIVEDDVQTAEYVGDSLSQSGWEVDLAGDGEAALSGCST
jgi:DNA-binding response OmpR family regulator